MVHFDVTVVSKTESSFRHAKLYLASGIIEFKGEEFSCIESEKNSGCRVLSGLYTGKDKVTGELIKLVKEEVKLAESEPINEEVKEEVKIEKPRTVEAKQPRKKK